MDLPTTVHVLLRRQCGQVSPAMNKPAASPIRWLLADECSDSQPRVNSACWYIEASQRSRKSEFRLKTSFPISCQATDQLIRRIAVSRELAQFGPMRCGKAMNHVSRCSNSRSM